jgi:predicted HAD superfamily Cof-like phosphohydrolase
MTADERLAIMRADFDYCLEALESLKLDGAAFYQETNQHEMVKAFYKKFGVPIPDAPTFDFPVEFRLNLIEEEFTEMKDAIAANDMPEFVDAVCDLLYVVHGIALAAGIHHIQPFFEEVHKTNLAKVGGQRSAEGKILKPEGWQPPRIAELLAERYGDQG